MPREHVVPTRVMPTRTMLVASTIALSLAACIPLPGGRTLASYTVVEKTGQNTLIASTGQSCQVSRETFEKVAIGASHSCVWLRPGEEAGGDLVGDGPRTGAQQPRRTPITPAPAPPEKRKWPKRPPT